MKRLSDAQKTDIRNLRSAGLGYKSIAERLSLSRETVRSFCVRNAVSCRNTEAEEPEVHHSARCGRTEMKAGNTVFIISTGYSEKASETLENKLEKLILGEASKQSGSYQFVQN